MFMNTINEKKIERILNTAFSSREPLILSEMPVKYEKQKLVMEVIAAAFPSNMKFTESELNDRLEAIHPDYVSLRRMLIDFRLFDRTRDGRTYWRVTHES